MNLGIQIRLKDGKTRFVGKIINAPRWGLVLYREIRRSTAVLWKEEVYSIDKEAFDWAVKVAPIKGLLQWDGERKHLLMADTDAVLASKVSEEGDERPQYRVATWATVGDRRLHTTFTNRVKYIT